ncbi:hypothetical protein EDD17DRAFT_1506965 [Pisolithus thermaeus]|nr:hypothetical protein EDD17DRAFT_1506965 [Pisolithus thermaeus]
MNDVIPVIQNTLITILMWMQQLLGMQIVGIDDWNNWNEPQSNLCSVVIVNITFFQFELLSSYSHSGCWTNLPTSTVLEDAFLAVGLSCNFYWYGLESSIDLHMPLLTSSKHLKDLRDTSRRWTRHCDEKLLKGGIGLPTGLGWTDRSCHLQQCLLHLLSCSILHGILQVIEKDIKWWYMGVAASHVMIQLPGYIYQIALMLV